ncbi:MAG: hypothetical protein V1778_02160 [bacterium]
MPARLHIHFERETKPPLYFSGTITFFPERRANPREVQFLFQPASSAVPSRLNLYPAQRAPCAFENIGASQATPGQPAWQRDLLALFVMFVLRGILEHLRRYPPSPEEELICDMRSRVEPMKGWRRIRAQSFDQRIRLNTAATTSVVSAFSFPLSGR